MARPRGTEALIALVIVGLCTYAVLRQFGAAPFGEDAIGALEIGERLDLTVALPGIGDDGKTYALRDLWGERLTVLYTWSLLCPCVEDLEPRLRRIYADFGPHNQGVAWIAIDGEPNDEPAIIRKVMAKLRSFYHLLRDPQQVVVRRLGLPQAVQVAILDREGRLLWRGPVDDNYDEAEVTRTFLREALVAISAGEKPPVAPDPTYGCEFNDPASCEEAEAEAEAIRARRRAAKEDKSATPPAVPAEPTRADAQN